MERFHFRNELVSLDLKGGLSGDIAKSVMRLYINYNTKYMISNGTYKI